MHSLPTSQLVSIALKIPRTKVLESNQNYWKGVLLIPERVLIVGKLDNVLAGSVQIIKPAKNNEAQAHSCILSTFFFAPWARGFGLAKEVFVSANKTEKEAFQTKSSKLKEEKSNLPSLDYVKSENEDMQLLQPNGIVLSKTNPINICQQHNVRYANCDALLMSSLNANSQLCIHEYSP